MALHETTLTICAVVIYASGFRIVTSLVQDRAVWFDRFQVPWLSVALLVVTGAVNLWQLADQSLVGSLGRDPGDLTDGYLWKVLTPLLIQSDSVAQLVSNTVSFVLVVPLAELVLGAAPVLALYLLGGMARQAAGFA